MTQELLEQLLKRYPNDYWDENDLKVTIITQEDYEQSVRFYKKCELLGMNKQTIIDSWVGLRKQQYLSDMWDYKYKLKTNSIVAIPKVWMSMPDLRGNLDRLQVPYFVDEISPGQWSLCLPKEVNLKLWNDRVNSLFKAFQSDYSDILRLKVSSENLVDLDNLTSDSSYKTIDLTRVNAPNVQTLSCLAKNCRKLFDLELPSTFGEIKSIYAITTNCRELESLDLSMLHGTLTTASYAFDGCTKLRYVDMRNLIFDSSTYVKALFTNTAIKEVIINKQSYESLSRFIPSNKLHVIQD